MQAVRRNKPARLQVEKQKVEKEQRKKVFEIRCFKDKEQLNRKTTVGNKQKLLQNNLEIGTFVTNVF